MLVQTPPFVGNVDSYEFTKELKPEERVKETLEYGRPLSPNDLVVYTTLISRSPKYLGEKPSEAKETMMKLYEGWQDILEIKKSTEKKPEGGWAIMKDRRGWDEFPKAFGPWGEGMSFGIVAAQFCNERAMELSTGAVDRLPGEDINISNHIRSLRETASLIVAPENNLKESTDEGNTESI